MAGKMFAAGNHAVILKTHNDRQSQLADFGRRGSERAIAYNRIFRIAMNIKDGREIKIDSGRFQFLRRNLSHAVTERNRIMFGHVRHRREYYKLIRQARNPAPFLVNSDKKGGSRGKASEGPGSDGSAGKATRYFS